MKRPRDPTERSGAVCSRRWSAVYAALGWLAGCDVSRPPVTRPPPPDAAGDLDGPSPSRDASEDSEGPAVPWPPPGASPRVEPAPVGRWTVEREIFSPEDRASIAGVALGDCDGDGLLDALTLGQAAPFAVHRGLGGGRFERPAGAVAATNSRAATFVDLDGDGAEDIVTADRDVAMYRNLGGCRFGPRRELAPPMVDFAVQVLATDANLDGLTDFAATRLTSLTAPLRLLIARGDGTYEDTAPALTPLASNRRTSAEYFGFGLYFEDIDDDGARDLFALVDQGLSWFSWGVAPGALTYRRDDALTMLFARSDPMSLSPLDFDRDGRVDWFAAGVVSHSLLLWHRGGRTLPDVAERAGVEGAGDDYAWGAYAFDADLDGWADLLVRRVGIDRPFPQPHPPGPTDLFLNRHDGTFAPAGSAVIDLQAAGKNLACGPASPRGEAVCFTSDMQSEGGPPILLVNGLRPRGRQGLLRLRGTVSSPDATGARVTVEGVSPPLVLVLTGQCPFGGEHARVLQVPLGAAERATVTVRWPSGIVQRGVEVRADTANTASEPAAVTLDRRVLPADGSGTVAVVVDPRAAGAARVELALEGVGAWAGEATTDGDGRVRRLLRAPTAPGEARVVVTLDGEALRVRPRVIFTPPP